MVRWEKLLLTEKSARVSWKKWHSSRTLKDSKNYIYRKRAGLRHKHVLVDKSSECQIGKVGDIAGKPSGARSGELESQIKRNVFHVL